MDRGRAGGLWTGTLGGGCEAARAEGVAGPGRGGIRCDVRLQLLGREEVGCCARRQRRSEVRVVGKLPSVPNSKHQRAPSRSGTPIPRRRDRTSSARRRRSDRTRPHTPDAADLHLTVHEPRRPQLVVILLILCSLLTPLFRSRCPRHMVRTELLRHTPTTTVARPPSSLHCYVPASAIRTPTLLSHR